MRAFINRLRLAISKAITPAWADKVNREIEQGSTLTLSKQADAMNFWPGMQIEASSADGSNPADTLRSGGTVGYLTVGSVNRDLGTVTFTDLTGLRAFIDRLRLAISKAIAPSTRTCEVYVMRAFITSTVNSLRQHVAKTLRSRMRKRTIPVLGGLLPPNERWEIIRSVGILKLWNQDERRMTELYHQRIQEAYHRHLESYLLRLDTLVADVDALKSVLTLKQQFELERAKTL